jgi:hypothetical protein
MNRGGDGVMERLTDSAAVLVRQLLLGLSVVSATAGASADDSRRALLNTELEYIADLVRLARPALAAEHLNIVRREFPQETELISYYQGTIDFAAGRYAAAAVAFSRVHASGVQRVNAADVRHFLFRCHCHTGEFAKAEELLAASADDDWTAAAPLLLGRRLLAHSAAADDAALRTKALTLLETFVAEHAAHAMAPAALLTLAEAHYDQLEAALAVHGQGILPLRLQQLTNRVLARYRLIAHRYTDSAEAKRAALRIAQLSHLVD